MYMHAHKNMLRDNKLGGFTKFMSGAESTHIMLSPFEQYFAND